MREWSAERVAQGAGADLLAPASREAGPGGPTAANVDSRTIAAGELFVGLRGARTDGGGHGRAALAAGAWGALLSPEHARDLLASDGSPRGAVLAHPDPLAGLQALARAWRRELGARGARVVAVTGSSGKTSTKDILAVLLASFMRVSASSENLNTEVGLPLALLASPPDSEAIVLEMAMRGPGQIAELAAIAEPDVGVIVNIGPAHLERLGSLEAIAAAKAELIASMAPGGRVVLPAREPLLAPHLREDLDVTTFGEGGEVTLIERAPDGTVVIGAGGEEITLRPTFGQAHNLRNLLAAVAVARAFGHTPSGALEVVFSGLRGQRRELAGDVVLINDCYNANPMSMRAALDDLAASAPGRTVAVLGDMLELGAESPRLHREVGVHASRAGVALLVAVGPLARELTEVFDGESHAVPDAAAAASLLDRLLEPGDTVLVKGSRGVGLEAVADRLGAGPFASPAPSAGRGRV